MPTDTDRLPRRLHLGRGHRLVPDRGRRPRGRPRRERLGPLLRDARARCATATRGEVACDFYHRYRDDVALMRELGLDAFRFSIAWPRVLPEGRGRVNEAGLDFYDRLVDELLAHDIEPFATLFHWDTPQALEDDGGWPARATAEAFAEYAEIVAARLGDRVRHWMTHNEPWVHAWIGHSWGEHAPGRTSEARRRRGRPSPAARRTAGRSTRSGAPRPTRRSASRSTSRTRTRPPTRPRTRRPRGRSTATATAGSSTRSSAARIPPTCSSATSWSAPFVHDGDLEAIAAPIDFLGVNNYFRFVVSAGADGPRMHARPRGPAHGHGLGGLPGRPARAARRASPRTTRPRPIYVTENGAAFGDVRVHDGRVHDPERTAYLRVPHRRGSAARSPPACPSRATSSGACSTTSSGRMATRSGSGSSTSTTRRSSACPRTASTGTGISIGSRPRQPAPSPVAAR